MSRQNLFILTYIGRVGESEVNAPAALPDHPGIISILCRGAAQSSFDAPLSTGATVGGWGRGWGAVSFLPRLPPSLSLVECRRIERKRWRGGPRGGVSSVTVVSAC